MGTLEQLVPGKWLNIRNGRRCATKMIVTNTAICRKSMDIDVPGIFFDCVKKRGSFFADRRHHASTPLQRFKLLWRNTAYMLVYRQISHAMMRGNQGSTTVSHMSNKNPLRRNVCHNKGCTSMKQTILKIAILRSTKFFQSLGRILCI